MSTFRAVFRYTCDGRTSLVGSYVHSFCKVLSLQLRDIRRTLTSNAFFFSSVCFLLALMAEFIVVIFIYFLHHSDQLDIRLVLRLELNWDIEMGDFKFKNSSREISTYEGEPTRQQFQRKNLFISKSFESRYWKRNFFWLEQKLVVYWSFTIFRFEVQVERCIKTLMAINPTK